MEIHFLGTGAADWPNPGHEVGDGRRFASVLLGKSLLVDCGPMTMAAIDEFQIDVNLVDNVIIGHPHGDHFHFPTICALASRRSADSVPLRLHLNAVATVRAQVPPELHGRLQVIPYLPGDTFSCGPFACEAVAANHNCDFGEKPAHLLLSHASGTRLFYALDGSWLPSSTWGFLRRQQQPVDAIIWELTCGDTDDWRLSEHCNLAMIKAMTRALRANSQLITPETALFCSHLSRRLCPQHAFFAPWLATQGFTLAYDNLRCNAGIKK